MATATPRPNYSPGDSLEQWMTAELRRNPNYQLPHGYSVDDSGTVTRDQPNFLLRHPWIFTAAGAGAAGGIGLAGAGGAGTAGTSAAATGAGTGGTGVAGTTAIMDPWYGVAPAATGSRVGSLLLNPNVLSAGIGTAGQLFAAHEQSQGATEAAKIQAAYLEKALEYEKQRDAYQQQLEASRYGNIQQHLGPYMQLGESAAARIQKLLGGGALPGMVQQPSVPHETIATPDIGVLPTQQPYGAPVLHTNPIPQRRI